MLPRLGCPESIGNFNSSSIGLLRAFGQSSEKCVGMMVMDINIVLCYDFQILNRFVEHLGYAKSVTSGKP